jgi:hypothetical protein
MRWRTAAAAGALMVCAAPVAASAAEVSGIGTYARPSGNGAGHWDLRYTPSAGALDAALDFGEAGTLPVVGDWNSDGTTDFGTMTPAALGNSLFRLRTASGPLEFRFGTGVIPVSGDFNGDHKTDIGTYTPPADADRAGHWQLRYSLTAGSADLDFSFGTDTTGLPVTGDWDGDGLTDVGLYIPGAENSTGRWQLRTSAGGEADFAFGDQAPYPVTGDWNGDGRADIGVYTPPALNRDGRWQLRSGTSAGVADLDFRFGSGTYPVAGDWNGPTPIATPTATPTQVAEATPAPLPAPAPAAMSSGLATLEPMNARVAYNWTVKGTRLTLTQLIARELPAGSAITISCSGKRCPIKKTTIKPKGSSRNLLSSLKSRAFRAGQTIDVRLAAPGHHTKLLRFKLARGKVPTGRAYCVRVGEKALRAKC